mmetsp:Transcript_79503/g.233703  ORF Transcript_79503/g.233703 Transcript_79503/m.233703 type:complete len:351 (+) Transcript_79503:174-1226(+)
MDRERGCAQLVEAIKVLAQEASLAQDGGLQLRIEVLRYSCQDRDLVLLPTGAALRNVQRGQPPVDLKVVRVHVQDAAGRHADALPDVGHEGLDKLGNAPDPREDLQVAVHHHQLLEVENFLLQVFHHVVELVQLALIGAVVEELLFVARAARMHLACHGVMAGLPPPVIRCGVCRGGRAKPAADARMLVHAEGAYPVPLRQRVHFVQAQLDVQGAPLGELLSDGLILVQFQRVRDHRGDEIQEEAGPCMGHHGAGQRLQRLWPGGCEPLGVGCSTTTGRARQRDHATTHHVVCRASPRVVVRHRTGAHSKTIEEVQQCRHLNAPLSQLKDLDPVSVASRGHFSHAQRLLR